MKEIKLTRGRVALVDDEDYEYLNQWKWKVTIGSNTEYAIRVKSIYVDGKRVRKLVIMHRLILNAPSNMQVDHVNHNGLDNRRCNIRLATMSQNNSNRKAYGVSKFLGVYFYKPRQVWRARLKINGKLIELGHFKIEEDAAKSYDVAAKKYHGEFANLNFPNG